MGSLIGLIYWFVWYEWVYIYISTIKEYYLRNWYVPTWARASERAFFR